MKFKVDDASCIGCGACASICEEVFEITDDGYAKAKDEEVTDEYVLERAKEAKENCPTEAIKEEND